VEKGGLSQGSSRDEAHGTVLVVMIHGGIVGWRPCLNQSQPQEGPKPRRSQLTREPVSKTEKAEEVRLGSPIRSNACTGRPFSCWVRYEANSMASFPLATIIWRGFHPERAMLHQAAAAVRAESDVCCEKPPAGPDLWPNRAVIRPHRDGQPPVRSCTGKVKKIARGKKENPG
jgi:hypothetical protein